MGGEMAVQRINEAGGIAGREMNIEWVHEGNPIENYRRFVDKDYDVAFGPTSSGRHEALAPEVESRGLINLAFAGNFTALYYDVIPDPTYSFRPSNMVLMQDMAAALAAREHLDDVTRIAGINPDYAAGRGSMENFQKIMNTMSGGETEVVYNGFPELLSEDYSTHITSALDANPDVIFTILWGPDILTFLNQAAAQGVFEETTVINHYIYNQINDVSSSLVEQTNGNLLAGCRNVYWNHPDHNRYQNARDFVQEAQDEFDVYPNFSFMEGYLSVTAWATAAEKAVDIYGKWPTQKELANVLENHHYYSPFAYHTVRGDHTGLQSEFYGVLETSDQYDVPVLRDTVQYGPEQVAPPAKTNPDQWISQWQF